MQKNEWFRDWFDETYLKIYSKRDDSEASRFIDWIAENYSEQAIDGVADIACGAGRHAFAMSRKYNWNVYALDLSMTLLEQAYMRLNNNQKNPHFCCGDIRELPFLGNQFGLVINVFTSFGYFEDDQSHNKVLEEFNRILKNDGILIIDLLNKSWLTKTLNPISVDIIEKMKITQKRAISPDNKFVRKEILIEHLDGQSRSVCENVRMFEQDEFLSMADSAQFKVEKLIGNYSGDSFDIEESPRMIFCLRKRS